MPHKRMSRYQRWQNKIDQVLIERRQHHATAATFVSRSSAIGDEYDEELSTGIPDTNKTSRLAFQLMRFQLASRQAKLLATRAGEKLEKMRFTDQAARKFYRTPPRRQPRDVDHAMWTPSGHLNGSKSTVRMRGETVNQRMRKVRFARYPTCQRVYSPDVSNSEASLRCEQVEGWAARGDNFENSENVPGRYSKRQRLGDHYDTSSSPSKRQKRAHRSVWPVAYTETVTDVFADCFEYQNM